MSRARYNLTEPFPLKVEHVVVEFTVPYHTGLVATRVNKDRAFRLTPGRQSGEQIFSDEQQISSAVKESNAFRYPCKTFVYVVYSLKSVHLRLSPSLT